MDDIFIKKCTEADVDILRRLLSKTFSETFAHMNTPENVKKAAKYVCPSNEEDGGAGCAGKNVCADASR